MKVAPSMLSADFANLYADIEMVNNSEADYFHLWLSRNASHCQICPKTS